MQVVFIIILLRMSCRRPGGFGNFVRPVSHGPPLRDGDVIYRN